MSFYDLLVQHSKECPTRFFIEWQDRSYTYEQFFQMVLRLSKTFSSLLGRRKIVFILSADAVFQLSCFLAVQKQGAIPVLLHRDLPPEKIQDILIQNQGYSLIADQPLETKFFPKSKKIGAVWYDLGAEHTFEDEEVSFGVLTSGSTATPKVLYRTDKSWIDFFPIQNKIFEMSSDSTLYFNGSLSFTGNLNLALATLYLGGTLIGDISLSPKVWIRQITQKKPSHLYLIPTKLLLLCSYIPDPILDIQMILGGSQMLNSKEISWINRAFPASQFILYYGASELNYVTWIFGQDLLRKPNSVGRPFPEVQVQIQDQEIYVSSKFLAANVENPCTVHDIGYWDPESDLIFEGRKGSLLNLNGIQISKEIFCTKINALPFVRNAELLALTEENKRQKFALFLTLSIPLTQAEVRQQLSQKLASYEMPHYLYLLEEMPLNTSGKPNQDKLKEYLKTKK